MDEFTSNDLREIERDRDLPRDQPDVDADEFKCDKCGEVWDIEDAIVRVKGEYLCPECAGIADDD